MFNTRLFARMKRGAYFINNRTRTVCGDGRPGRGAALRPPGAGLDVADPEPLPADHPLWSMPNALITPHVAIYGTPYREKWEAILIENCRRFAAGQPLLNLVASDALAEQRVVGQVPASFGGPTMRSALSSGHHLRRASPHPARERWSQVRS
jgi:phosphoglycerate dehydrogenase-like enzyme